MSDDRRELLLYHARELIHRIQVYTEPGREVFFRIKRHRMRFL